MLCTALPRPQLGAHRPPCAFGRVAPTSPSIWRPFLGESEFTRKVLLNVVRKREPGVLSMRSMTWKRRAQQNEIFLSEGSLRDDSVGKQDE